MPILTQNTKGKMRKIFVNENVEMFEYDAAEPLLKDKNDLQYFDPIEEGVHKVPKERWTLAQKFEKTFWIEKNPSAKEDRNQDHFEKFGSFESVKNELPKINSIMELGCGAFTNLKLLLNKLNNPKIALLDPLINDYINLEHCSYKTGKISDNPVSLINSSIEDFTPAKYSYEIPAKFDAVIMINVIEHCYDVNLIFNKILEILNKGGVFIFSDVYFTDVQNIMTNLYDAGHPLHLSEKKMDGFLKNFEPIFDKRYHQLYGQEWRNDIYFIGKKI